MKLVESGAGSTKWGVNNVIEILEWEFRMVKLKKHPLYSGMRQEEPWSLRDTLTIASHNRIGIMKIVRPEFSLRAGPSEILLKLH